MSLKGNLASIARFSAGLKRLPTVVAQKVAAAAAPALTDLTDNTFRASEDAYGNAWLEATNGQRVTLRRTGALAARVVYVAIGTRLRVALGVRYAKYQIGKRPIFPRAGAPLPTAYANELKETSQSVIRTEIGGGS